jgi:1,4-alpha-glucan branching enzyme
MDKRGFETAATPVSVDVNTPMGANLQPGGVAFRCWAPRAQSVYVVTGAALQAARKPPFVPDPTSALTNLGDETWAGFVPGLGDGDHYLFWVEGANNDVGGLKRNPRSRELSIEPAYPDCDCIVHVPWDYPWHDAGFRPPEFRDLILYQLHIGVYYGVDAQGKDKRRSIAKFLDLLDRVDYLKDLGINGVQLMPIQEFATTTSLGYNGLDLYSPEMDYVVCDDAELSRYLPKVNAFLDDARQPLLSLDQLRRNQLRCVIDIFHLNGMAVLFDLVFNHAGGGFDERSLWFFDRQPQGNNNLSLYFTDQGWAGGLIFAYWNAGVRQFLIDNGKQVYEEWHVDGIRYDEVTVIDNHGGGRFCQDLTSTLRYEKPQAIQIAEYWGDDRAAAVRAAPNGLGFDAAWGDKLRDGIRGAVAQMAGGYSTFVDIDALAGSFDVPWGFDAAWRAVNAIENHDLVYAGRDRRIAAMADPSNSRSWYARSRTRAATGLMFAGRGIPQLFMGEEILEDKQWSDDINFHANLLIWWDGLTGDPVMRDFHAFCRDLIWLRRNHAALRSESLRVSTRNSLDRVMGVHRWIEGSGQDVLIVFNLQETNHYGYRVGFPAGGTWREIFNSDAYDDVPNHVAVGNNGAIAADDGYAWDGMPASAEITIPANGFIAFAR